MKTFVGHETLAINGQSIRLHGLPILGEGHEGVVIDVSSRIPGRAIKLLKSPSEYTLPEERELARERLAAYPAKVAAFSKISSLPSEAVIPEQLLHSPDSDRLGLLMPLVQGGYPLANLDFPDWRRERNLSLNYVMRVFCNLHRLVDAVHQRGIVLRDFKPQNVLVKGQECYLIDLDGSQIRKHLTQAFTDLYIDPKLCDPAHPEPRPIKPGTPESDWYSFAVILFQTIFGVHPFGGVYRPEQDQEWIEDEHRIMKGIPISHPQVIYPVSAPPLEIAPTALLDIFWAYFREGWRQKFPLSALRDTKWFRCECGLEVGRDHCPVCSKPPMARPVELPEFDQEELPVAPESCRQFPGDPVENRTVTLERGTLCRNLENLMGGVEREMVTGAYASASLTLILLGRKLLCFLPSEICNLGDIDSDASGKPALCVAGEALFYVKAGELLCDKTGSVRGLSLGSKYWLIPVDNGCLVASYLPSGELELTRLEYNESQRKLISVTAKIPLKNSPNSLSCSYTTEKIWLAIKADADAELFVLAIKGGVIAHSSITSTGCDAALAHKGSILNVFAMKGADSSSRALLWGSSGAEVIEYSDFALHSLGKVQSLPALTPDHVVSKSKYGLVLSKDNGFTQFQVKKGKVT